MMFLADDVYMRYMIENMYTVGRNLALTPPKKKQQKQKNNQNKKTKNKKISHKQ